MEIVQRFALENIYCSPAEDKQFRFKLTRATRSKMPASGSFLLFDRYSIKLPDPSSDFHIFLIGRTPPPILNLKPLGGGCCMCPKTGWVNVAEDMNARSYIFQIYDDNGLNLPRDLIYYTLSSEGHLVIAVKLNKTTRFSFNLDDFKYLRVYSNRYYNKDVKDWITIKGGLVTTKNELMKLIWEFDAIKKSGGTVFYYINGSYTDSVPNDTPMNSYVECMYDAGVIHVDTFNLNTLKTFMSEKDKRPKYLIHRKDKDDYIHYSDDLEIYILGENKEKKKRGVYYYQNLDHALRNVTDKDYAIDTNFVSKQAQYLAKELNVGLNSIKILVNIRGTYAPRKFIYHALKLHEMYKLPFNIQTDIMNGQGNYLQDWRVEKLENSDYFNLAGCIDLNKVTKEFATETIGYNGCSYYFGYTPEYVDGRNQIRAPELYKSFSYAYEYDKKGVLLGWYITNDVFYSPSNKDAYQVEFIQGRRNAYYTLVKQDEEAVLLPDREYRVIAADYIEFKRTTEWTDITDKTEVVDGKLKYIEDKFTHFRVIYIDEPYIRDMEIDISRSFPILMLSMDDCRNGEYFNLPLDIYYDSLEIFLNGYRLIDKLDYFLDYPYISICNKEYLKYDLPKQKLHIRATGSVLTREEVNARESIGFVNHGVLSRNNYYDIRDDRVFSTWVKGMLYERKNIKFAEEDNTVRLLNPMNGMPYAIMDRKLSIKRVTGLNTEKYHASNESLNKRVSELFNNVYPQPKINEFNAIREKHYLFSPLVSKILHDVIYGVIPPETYTRNYHQQEIRDLIDENYWLYGLLDPIRYNLPYKLVEIHPDFGGEPVNVNVYQYRFIYNLVSIITNGDMDKINLSSYLRIDTDATDVVDEDEVFDINDPGEGAGEDPKHTGECIIVKKKK